MPKLFGVEVSDHVYEQNKHLIDQPKEEKTAARKRLEAEMREQFARQFEQTWALLDGPVLETEHVFHAERNWRSDYLHRPTRTLIELEGGAYSGGRHVRGPGFVEDCMKYNEALMLGYRVFRIPTGTATVHYLDRLIQHLTKAES